MHERGRVRKSERKKVNERWETEKKMRKRERERERESERERERDSLISECVLCIYCTRRDCHHLTDKKIHM